MLLAESGDISLDSVHVLDGLYAGRISENRRD